MYSVRQNLIENSLSMKKITNFPWILVVLLFGICHTPFIQAQETPFPSGMAPMTPIPGYVLLNTGDTIFGRLTWSLKYVENNPVEIKFTAPNKVPVKYGAGDIKGFGQDFGVLPEWEYYASLPSQKKGVPVFMNRLIGGKITVYLNRQSIGVESVKSEEITRIDGIAFSYVPGEGLIIGPSYRTDYRIIEQRIRYSSYFVSKGNGAIIKVEKENYNEIFTTLFGDCPQIDNEVNKDPDLIKFKKFMILVEVYNQLCPDAK